MTVDRLQIRIAQALALALVFSAPTFGCGTTADPDSDAANAGTGGLSPATGGTGGGGAGGSGTGGAGRSGAGGSQSASGGTGGSHSGSGGMSGQSGSGGASGSGASDAAMPTSDAATDAGGEPSDDRCDVANLDPSKMPAALVLSGSLGTHDPSMIAAHGMYYEFQTGDRIPTKVSTDMRTWQDGPRVFAQKPAWIAQQVAGAMDLWAPDISFFGGMYHLYYSASTFGSMQSCIGHATRAALNAGEWTDHGAVICSNPDGGKSDNWNAIDPNAIVDQAGTPWLTFGSFWSGIQQIKLDANGARADDEVRTIATRQEADGALEAPYVVRRCGYYYLFASFDKCCNGASSTYNIRVGRSTSVNGPYADRDGKAMLQGGGTQLVKTAGRWHGPGHNAVLFTDSGAFNIYHAYDANQNGASILRISELAWDADGWPVSGGP